MPRKKRVPHPPYRWTYRECWQLVDAAGVQVAMIEELPNRHDVREIDRQRWPVLFRVLHVRETEGGEQLVFRSLDNARNLVHSIFLDAPNTAA